MLAPRQAPDRHFSAGNGACRVHNTSHSLDHDRPIHLRDSPVPPRACIELLPPPTSPMCLSPVTSLTPITLSKCCNFGFCNRWIRKPAHHFYFTWILPLPLLIERVQVKCIILTNWAKWSQKDPDFPHINLELESCDCARAPLRWSSGRNRCPHSMKAMQIAARDVPLTCAFEA